jgi:hypothetical protein
MCRPCMQLHQVYEAPGGELRFVVNADPAEQAWVYGASGERVGIIRVSLGLLPNGLTVINAGPGLRPLLLLRCDGRYCTLG